MGNKQLTNGGIALLIIGIILTIVGIILFCSVFFTGFNSFGGNPFGIPGFHSGYSNSIPFGRAIVGIILAGIGGIMTKIGLGMSVIGSSEDIARWAGKVINEGKKTTGLKSPECGNTATEDSAFCNKCGARLTK